MLGTGFLYYEGGGVSLPKEVAGAPYLEIVKVRFKRASRQPDLAEDAFAYCSRCWTRRSFNQTIL